MKVDADAVDRLVDLALGALARHEPIAPAALTVLLRRYAATGREDLGDALGSALGSALKIVASEDDASTEDDAPTAAVRAHDAHATADRPDRFLASSQAPEWIWLFVEAAAVSDDDRLPAVAAALVSALCREWPLSGSVAAAMRSLDACLYAAHPIGRPELIAGIVDELERIVGLTYRPGLGVARTISQLEPDAGDLSDYSAAASALLTAYLHTGRLPYPMLAEELMQVARRKWWNEAHGGFVATNQEPLAHFVWNCDAARVLCRLAALHADREYRQAAVVAVEGDYAGDLARMLARLAPAGGEHGLAGAVYGLALIEFSGLA